jgi:membrane peptidoglycan carboxypeptidase
MVAPALVERIRGPNGIPLYAYEEPAVSPAMSPETADKLKQLMMATVTRGSARKSFRGFHKGRFSDVSVGGKTGSLTGSNPRGRYDWFVGFAELGERRLAFATLCINKEKWYVKSTRLARELVEFYFKSPAEA